MGSPVQPVIARARAHAAVAGLAWVVLATSSSGVSQQQVDVSSAATSPTLSYEVYVDRTVTTAAVRLCFERGRPDVLVPWRSRAAPAITGAVDAAGRPLRIEQGGRVLMARSTGCVTYDLTLASPQRRSEFSRRVGDDLLVGQDLLLWVPEGSRRDLQASLSFTLPEGLTAHAPWPRDEHGAYHLDPTAFVQLAFVAVGTPESRTMTVREASVDVVRLGDDWTVPWDWIHSWVGESIEQAATVTDGLPAASVTIFLLPTDSPSVRYGMVRRGGGLSMMFQLGREAELDELRRSWVSSHEFVHLVHPGMPREDAWLFEGLATYYQEVLRVRRGHISEEVAWGNLIDGFRRGRHNRTGRTLRQESRQMWRTGRFPSVYWAGTAFVLDADVRLRTSSVPATIDSVLSGSLDAWAARRDGWRSATLLERCDGALPRPLLGPLRRRYVEETSFPDTNRVLAQLGVWERRGVVRLRDDAPLARVRRAIMRPDAL